MTKLISEQIRSRPDFHYGTKLYYKTHTWRVALYQPNWRCEDRKQLQDIWYRNRQIEKYLKETETTSYKTRADRNYFVYLTRPDAIPWIVDNYDEDIVEISGPVNSKHQDILLNDLTVVTRPRLWYKKFRYKIMSTRYGPREQEVFEEIAEFCQDTLEHGTYKLNDTFRITSKCHQRKMANLFNINNNSPARKGLNPSWKNHNPIYKSPFTATGSIYLVNHDDVVTLHMVYKKYITKTNKVVTLDEL